MSVDFPLWTKCICNLIFLLLTELGTIITFKLGREIIERREENDMKAIAYSIVGLFFLSLLLVATSFANETYGSTRPDMAQMQGDPDNTLSEYGVQPYWGTDWSDIPPHTAGDPDNTLTEYGLQSYLGTSWLGMDQTLGDSDNTLAEYGLQPYSGTR